MYATGHAMYWITIFIAMTGLYIVIARGNLLLEPIARDRVAFVGQPAELTCTS